MKTTNTNWSSPKTNIFAGTLTLISALQSGHNARLIRMKNEDCAFPIRVKRHDTDFRNYEFSSGHPSTREEILNEKHRTDFQKELTLNYKTCYGTDAAVKRYYEKGLLSSDNFKGMGRSHLVKVSDMVRFLTVTGDQERAEMFKRQYLTGEEANQKHFYDFYSYKHGSLHIPKTFKRKVWVVELLSSGDEKANVPVLAKIMNVLTYPLRFIPKRSVLKMDNYKLVSYSIGGVKNGYEIEFHIPKKFSFK